MASPTHCTFRNKAAAKRVAASYRKQFGLGLDGNPRRRRIGWRNVLFVIGCFDSHGVIHHKIHKLDDRDTPTHSGCWPMMNRATWWRFLVSQWRLDNSVFSKESRLDDEQVDKVLRLMHRKISPPKWVGRYKAAEPVNSSATGEKG